VIIVKKEIKLSEAIGKTIEGFGCCHCQGQIVITFTDGTFVTLGVEYGYEHGDEFIADSVIELNHFNNEEIIRLGIAT
jgi:hypothetical protein